MQITNAGEGVEKREQLKSVQITNARNGAEKNEPSYTVGGISIGITNYGEQYGSFLQN